MGFLHSSRPHGRVSRHLKRASDVRLVGIDGEGDQATWLHFEIPPFYSAAAQLFTQQRLWDDGPQPDDTAFELFGAALVDVSARKEESNRYDPALLQRIRAYNATLRRGVGSIWLSDVHLPVKSRIDIGVVQAASELSAATPEPQRVRVVGKLDVMSASQSVLKIHVQEGEFVTALWEGADPIDALTDLFNRDVVLEGCGVFRPSGSLLRIDATAIAPASPGDEFFRRVPRAVATRPDYLKTLRLKPGEKSVYAQILGSIPAEESDEEFVAAVEALS
jgi:hypothetical protein